MEKMGCIQPSIATRWTYAPLYMNIITSNGNNKPVVKQLIDKYFINTYIYVLVSKYSFVTLMMSQLYDAHISFMFKLTTFHLSYLPYNVILNLSIHFIKIS